MVYTPRPVDLELFVNSASKGFNDGAKVPSAFASFVDSFTKGIDAEQKYESEAQQQTIRQNQIDQLPVANRIQEATATTDEANAVTKEADANVIKQHPDEYAAAKLAEMNAKAANDKATAIINAQKSELTNILSGDDPIAKGRAVASGKFDSIMSEAEKRQVVQSSYPGWADEDKKIYNDQVHAQQTKDWTDAANKQAVEKAPEYNAALISDPALQDIRNQIPGNVSYPDLLTKGQITTIKVPAQVPAFVLDANGKPTDKPLLDDFGNQKFVNDPLALPGAKVEERRVFQYNGKQYTIGTTGISSDTYKTFNNAQTNYSFTTERNLGQFYGGVSQADKEVQDAKAKASAQVSLDYEKNASEARTAQDNFNAGAAVAPPYQAAAKEVRANIDETRAIKAANAKASETPTPNATTIPDFTPGAYTPAGTPAAPQGQPLSTSTPVATLPDTGTPTPVRTEAPAFTVTPGTASPIAMKTFQSTATLTGQSGTSTPTPAPTGSPGTSPEATATATPLNADQQQAKLKAQLAQSKAQQLADKKYNPTNTPTPVNQAKETVSSSFVPPKMTLNISTRYAPQTEAVHRVASRPELEGFSAAAKAIAVQESGGNPDAVSPTNVKGVMQVTKKTARDITPNPDLNNPVDNAMRGAIYIEKALSTPAFSNNPMLAFTSYNGGSLVVQEAVRLAGTTDWDKVKAKLIEAGGLPNVRQAWLNEGLSPKYLDSKPKEVYEYADRVVANFPSFVYTRRDMTVADKLKQQKVLSF